MKDRQSLVGFIVLFLSAVLLLLPDYIAPVCHADHPMKCQSMAQANQGVAVATMLVGVMFLKIKNRDMARGLALGGILLSCLAFANAAFLIGGCSSPVMSCNAKNIPATYLLSGLLILVQGYYLMKTAGEK